MDNFKIAYVLSEISWGYNDQYYSTMDTEAGLPSLVSFDKKKVEYLQREKTLSVLKTITLADFFLNETLEGSSLYRKVDALAKKHKIDIYSVLNASESSRGGRGQGQPLPDSFYESLYELSPDHFFTITEVEVC